MLLVVMLCLVHKNQDRLVAVHATKDKKGSFTFRDIELDDDSTGTEANIGRDE